MKQQLFDQINEQVSSLLKNNPLEDFEKNMRSWMNCNCVFISATNKENLEELRNTMILMVQDMYHKRYPYKTNFYS